MADRLVVIGGDAAGMSAASQARRLRPADELEIVAFERGSMTSYSACGIPYWVGGAVDDRDDLIVRRPETFRDDHAIDVFVRHEATAIDTGAGVVRVRDLEAGTERDEAYDQLMIATGAVPLRPDLPGIEGQGIHGIQTLDDGQAVLDALGAQPRTAVVVGSGYVGLEMAEAMIQRGLAVDVVEQAEQPMATLDPDMGAMVAEAMRNLGMRVHLATAVHGFELDRDGRVHAVVTAGGTLPADLVILGVGTRPDSAMADAAGVPVGDSGGIRTDARQRTAVDRVWSAGDCTESLHRVSRRPVAIALGTIANKQGRIAGTNLGGGDASFPGVLGTAATKVCGVEVARTGLSERAAREAGFEPVVGKVESTTRAGYFPGAEAITVKVLAASDSGRLLGGQIVGREGAAKRIDVLAVALWSDLRVDDLAWADLSYAPPFGPVWDPILLAARAASA